MANRQKLSSALSAGMRAAAVDKAIDKKQDPAEAVRVEYDLFGPGVCASQQRETPQRQTLHNADSS